MNSTHSKEGFTLIELGIVLLIMGVIAGVLGPALFSGIKQEKVTQGRNELRELRDSIIGFAIDKRVLPSDLSDEVGATDDVWGRKVNYQYWEELTNNDLCKDVDATEFEVEIRDSGSNIENIAFILSSDGQDHQPFLDLTPENVTSAHVTDLTNLDADDKLQDDQFIYVTLGHLKAVVCPASKKENPLPLDYLSRWEMDENTGSTVGDSASGGVDAVFSGPDGPEWTEAGDGHGLNFDNADSGLNAWLTVDYNERYDLTEFTILGWFRTAYEGEFGVITSKQTDYYDRNWWVTIWGNTITNQDNWNCTYTYAGGELALRVSTETYFQECFDGYRRGVNIGTEEKVTDDKWHFFTAQANASLARLYVDGELKAQQEDAGVPMTPQADVYIARGTIGSRSFNGTIADITIYEYMLDESTIVSVYEYEKSNYE